MRPDDHQMENMEQTVMTWKTALMSVQLPEQMTMMPETETTVMILQIRKDRADGDDGVR